MNAASRVEEIVVTAQRREENLQNVPISITAVTSQTLARANITSAASLQQVTPGLTFTSFGRNAFPYIRGIGTGDNTVGNESSVATYVDGVYLESTPAGLLELNNVERIEVLKGPQGTLFGRNATGGLIQIITRRPSRVPKGSVEIGYGNYQTVRGTAYLSGPLTSTLSANLAAVFSDQNKGWGRNVTLDREVSLGRLFSIRGKLLFESGGTEITLGGDYNYQGTDIGLSRNLMPGTLGRTRVPPGPPAPIPPLPGFYDSQSNLFPFSTTRSGGVNLRVEQDLGFGELISISSYRKTKLVSTIDTDDTPASVLEVNFGQRISAFTQELQLTSQNSGRLSWIVGAFYMHRNAAQPFATVVGSSFPPFFGGSTNIRQRVRTDVVAPYGQATMRIGERTDVTAGARYTIEHQDFRGVQTIASGAVISAPPAIPKRTYKEPTWRLAINHQFSNDLMAYVSYNRGFKSGVYSAIIDPPVSPEFVDAYEIGFKSELFDRALRLNGAAYQSEYKDIQLLAATGNPSAPTRSINAARARIRGVELSVEAVPATGLSLNIGGNYMPTAKYLSFPNAPFLPIDLVYGGNRPPISADNSGGRMIRAPKFTGTVSANYTFDVAGGELDLSANLYHSSRFLWNPDNADRRDLPEAVLKASFRQRSYTTINTQITYRAQSGLSAALWSRNLSNVKYRTIVSESAGNVYAAAAPRTYGVKLGYSF